MAYSKLDKLNTLTTLKVNKGNKLKTAKQMGVNRHTVEAWQKQLERDMKLAEQVDMAVKNLASLEEIQAIKAQAELCKRLDKEPHELEQKVGQGTPRT